MFARMLRASILHNRRRLAVALAAVLVPAALVTAVANFVLDARAKLKTELATRGPKLVIIGHVPDWALPGGAAPRCRTSATVAGGLEVPVIGIESQPMRALYPGWRVEGEWLREGCMVGARLADRLKLRPGDGLLGRTIDGIVETGEAEDDVVFVRRDPELPSDRIDIGGSDEAPVYEELARAFGTRFGVEARVQRQLAASEGAILGKLTLAFALVTLLVGAVSALSMAMSLAAGVAQRRHEFAILRALGARDDGIVRLLAAEVGTLLAVGLALGAAAGLALSQWLGAAVFGQSVAVRPLAIGAAALTCAIIAAASSVLPVRRALRVEPALALKEE